MNIARNLIVLLSLSLAGCSYYAVAKDKFTEHDRNYLAAHSVPPLKVPPGIASSAFQDLYPIPDRHYSETAKIVSPAPPGLLDPA